MLVLLNLERGLSPQGEQRLKVSYFLREQLEAWPEHVLVLYLLAQSCVRESVPALEEFWRQKQS